MVSPHHVARASHEEFVHTTAERLPAAGATAAQSPAAPVAAHTSAGRASAARASAVPAPESSASMDALGMQSAASASRLDAPPPSTTAAKTACSVTHALSVKGALRAWSMLHGYKVVANRSFRISPGWYALHTTNRLLDAADLDELRRKLGPDLPSDDAIGKAGVLCGLVRIAGSVTRGECLGTPAESWAVGPVCNLIEEAVVLWQQPKTTGYQGVWRLSEKTASCVHACLRDKRFSTTSVLHGVVVGCAQQHTRNAHSSERTLHADVLPTACGLASTGCEFGSDDSDLSEQEFNWVVQQPRSPSKRRLDGQSASRPLTHRRSCSTPTSSSTPAHASHSPAAAAAPARASVILEELLRQGREDDQELRRATDAVRGSIDRGMPESLKAIRPNHRLRGLLGLHGPAPPQGSGERVSKRQKFQHERRADVAQARATHTDTDGPSAHGQSMRTGAATDVLPRVQVHSCAGSSTSDRGGNVNDADDVGDEHGGLNDTDSCSQSHSQTSSASSTRRRGLLGGAFGDGDAARMDGVRLRKLTADPDGHGLIVRTGTCRGRSVVPWPHNYDMQWDDRPQQTVKTDLLPQLQVDVHEEFPSPLLGAEQWQLIGRLSLPEVSGDEGICPQCYMVSSNPVCPGCGRSPRRVRTRSTHSASTAQGAPQSNLATACSHATSTPAQTVSQRTRANAPRHTEKVRVRRANFNPVVLQRFRDGREDETCSLSLGPRGRGARQLSKAGVTHLQRTVGHHGHAHAWRSADVQPSGIVAVPACARSRGAKVKVETFSANPAGVETPPTPGNTTEAHTVTLLLVPRDALACASASQSPSSSQSNRQISAAVTLPCAHETINCTAVNALTSHATTTPIIYNECCQRLPPKNSAAHSQWVIHFHRAFQGSTFSALAATAAKAACKSLDIGELRLETNDNGIISVDVGFELPLHIEPTDLENTVPETWRLFVELFYTLPFQITEEVTEEDCVLHESSDLWARADVQLLSTTPRGNPSLLVPPREYAAISHRAMSDLPVPGHAGAIPPLDRFCVHFFFSAARRAAQLVRQESPFAELYHDFPLLAGPTVDRDEVNVIPVTLMTIGRFYGNSSLLNDDGITWMLRYTLASGGALRVKGGRKDLLIFNTQFCEMLRNFALPRVARVTKRVSWNLVRHIVLPIHEHNHWTLVVLRDMRCERTTTPGHARLSGSLSYYDSLRGDPTDAFRELLSFLCHALSTQLMRGRTVLPDGVVTRLRQPESDPRQELSMNCGRQELSMNCGAFCFMTAKSLFEGWPLANVSEVNMRYYREASALAMIRHPTESVDSHGLPMPLICMGACLGACVLDPPARERNCAPVALLAVLTNHVAFRDAKEKPTSTLPCASSLLEHVASESYRVRNASQTKSFALMKGLSRDNTGIQLARKLLAHVSESATLALDGTPVPVRALDAALRSLGVTALLLHCDDETHARSGGLYSLGKDYSTSSQVTCVMLYSSRGHHIVTLSWPEACSAHSFVCTSRCLISIQSDATSESGPALSGAHDLQQHIMSCYTPQLLCNHPPSLAWRACGSMPPSTSLLITPSYCKSIVGEPDEDGLASGKCTALLLSGRHLQIVGEFEAGKPCGAVLIQETGGASHEGDSFSIELDTERPTTPDYELAPTRIAEGFLWPRPTMHNGHLKRLVTFRLDGEPVRTYEASRSSSREGAVNLHCLDKEEERVAG